MKVELSIIVPVYNTENYLVECLNSLKNQTAENLEFIIVDDGSSDNSLEISKKFEKDDHRFRVFSKTNGGLSDARNYGLQMASGEYVGFVDSDDYISSNFCECIMKTMRDNACEIGVAAIQHVDESGKLLKLRCISSEVTVLKGEKGIEELLFSQRISNSVCNKIFDKKLFKNIKFPYGKLYEDEYVTYKLFDLASNVVVCSDALYYYRYNPYSITHNEFSERELDRVIASEEKVKFCKKKYPQLTHLAKKYLVYDCIMMLSKMNKYDSKYDEYILSNIRKYLLVFISGRNSWKGKMFATVAALNPKLAILITKGKRRKKNANG